MNVKIDIFNFNVDMKNEAFTVTGEPRAIHTLIKSVPPNHSFKKKDNKDGTWTVRLDWTTYSRTMTNLTRASLRE